jgi:glyoxylase-like metal-dependent hydrolase (beta-lactamase superfamily II)
MFSGDIVYTERMLSVRSYSHSGSWLTAFDTMAAFQPEYIVPGHGHVTTLEKAREDTYSYLRFLRDTVTEFMDSGGDIADVGMLDQSKYSYLANYEFLKGRNAQQVFQELEWE